MQRGPDSWHQRRGRDRNLDIFDKALIRFEQRGGRRAPQQLQSQPNLHQPRHREAAGHQQIPRSQASGIAELREEPAGEDSEMSRSSYQQYSRSSVSTSGGGGGGGGLLLPRRTQSIIGGPDFWSSGGGGGGGLSGSGFQRQEVFRRSFRQAPATSSSRQSQSFYSHSSTGGGGGGGGYLARPTSSMLVGGGGVGGMRVSVTETSTALGRQHQQQQQLGGAGSAGAYFSEGLVITPGSQHQHQHQQQYQVERQQLQHGSTGSVERELLNYRQTDGGVRFHQVSHAAANSPENVHSEGFLIQRRTVGPWQSAAGDASSRERHQQQQYQQVVEHHHQRQQSGGEYPVLRVRQPYKMNFVMSREAPAAYNSSAASDAVREQFASQLYSSKRGRQSVMGQGDGSYYQQQIVYHDNRGGSPRAFVPYQQAAEATATRSDGYGTIKEGTIHKHQAAEKSTARQQDIEAGLSRLELRTAGVPQQKSSQSREHVTTTTKISHAGHSESNARAQEGAAASQQQQQQVNKQSTVSKVATQNEQHEEEATFFHDGNRVRKRVKHRRYLDGKLIDEKEEVVSLNEEERKQMDAHQRQWQWKTSTNANGQTTSWTTTETSSHHTGQTAPASFSESRAGTTTTYTTSSAGVVKPKKRACACCYPRQRRYKSDTRTGESSGTTTTTTTTTVSADKPGKKNKKRDKKQAAALHNQHQGQTTTTVVTTNRQAAEQQNGRARQVAFEEQPVYN